VNESMISVLIASRDRAALLGSTLDTVSHQEQPGCPFEIIVVDNASLDDTPAVVSNAARQSPVPLVYLRETRPGKAYALNTALEHARGDLLVLTDDDVLVSPGWLGAYARAFVETGADFAVGRILPLWEAPPPRWLSPALYGVLAIPDGGTRRLTIAPGVNDHIMPLGANMAIRRHVAARVGGWNPELGKLQGTLRTGEDHEFALQMMSAGFTGVYEPAASVQHRVPAERLRLAYFHRWFYDNGGIAAHLEDLYPTADRHVLGVPRYLFRQFAGDVWSTMLGAATLDIERATVGEMRAAWFAGYVGSRWRRRHGRAPARSEPAAAQRS
jgi:glycosyltransferase involved in cell wall biosynthesis